jgi:hypothetical protein
MKLTKAAKEMVNVLGFEVFCYIFFVYIIDFGFGWIFAPLILFTLWMLISEIRNPNPRLSCEHTYIKHDYYFSDGTWYGFDHICTKCGAHGESYRRYF